MYYILKLDDRLQHIVDFDRDEFNNKRCFENKNTAIDYANAMSEKSRYFSYYALDAKFPEIVQD